MGLFAGGGLGVPLGRTDVPLQSGKTVKACGSKDLDKGDFGVGLGPGIKALPRLGVGIAAGAGVMGTATAVTPTLGQVWNRLLEWMLAPVTPFHLR